MVRNGMQLDFSAFSLLSVVLVGITGCDVNDYTPTVEIIESDYNGSSDFMVAANDIVGLYGNMDVDSLIYSYVARLEDVDTFWNEIEGAAEAEGWEIAEDCADYRQYERVVRHTTGFNHLELVRVAVNPETLKVTVAWVQEDFPVGAAAPEAESVSFASSVVWPKFREFRRTKDEKRRRKTRPGAPTLDD